MEDIFHFDCLHSGSFIVLELIIDDGVNVSDVHKPFEGTSLLSYNASLSLIWLNGGHPSGIDSNIVLSIYMIGGFLCAGKHLLH